MINLRQIAVSIPGREIFHSQHLTGHDEAEPVNVATHGARIIDLYVGDAGDGINSDHAVWADPAITLSTGETLWLDELKRGYIPVDFLESTTERGVPQRPIPERRPSSLKRSGFPDLTIRDFPN